MVLSIVGCGPRRRPESVYSEIEDSARHGDLDAALRQVNVASREYARNPEWACRFRILKGHVLVMRGSNDEALALLNEDLPPQFANTETAAMRRMTQGIAADLSGHFEDSAKYFADAEQLSNQFAPRLAGEIALASGSLEVDRADYPAAESAFRKSLQLARAQKRPFLEASALGSLGNVAMWEEHYDEAVEWYMSSLQLSQNLGTQYSLAKTLGNLGWSFSELGDFEKALDYFKQADAASAKAGLDQDRVYWLINTGNMYYQRRDYESAESVFQTALSLARQVDDKAAATECLDRLAVANLQQGHVKSARDSNAQAIEMLKGEQDHFLIPYSTLVKGRINAAAGNFDDARHSFEVVIADKNAGTSLRWEAQAQLAAADAAEGNRALADEEFQHSIQTIEAARASVKTEEFRLSFLSSAISVYSDYIDFLVGQGRTEDALQVAELSRARTLADGLGFSSATLSFPIRGFQPTKTARALGATILCYWLGARHSYVWAIDEGGIRLVRLPATDEIDPLVESYRRTLVGPRDALEADAATGEKLYSALIASAITKLPRGGRIVIIPDGSLYQLNFEALIAPNPTPHYWIDDALISNANSLVLLAASAHAEPANSKKLLLVGDPVPATDDFPKLPQAESEMKEVESYFPPADSTIYSNASATASAYLNSRPDQFSFIHFVAHGTASRTSPLDSAVILTKQGDSYKLYARDIIKQPLHAELVTISACHGAGERTYSGEGLVGLSWAFLHAGAHDVISALWEVDDNSTSQLMNRLYAEVSKDAPPEKALRDAKLALLHSDSVYKKPFYWAPFQIYRGP